MDKLDEIVELQDQLNSRFGWSQREILRKDEEGIVPEVGQRYIIGDTYQSDNHDYFQEGNRRYTADRFLSATQAEICEAREALSLYSRWWKSRVKPMKEVQEELVDCLHFLLSAMLATGMTSESIHQSYLEKNHKNNTRKDWEINE